MRLCAPLALVLAALRHAAALERASSPEEVGMDGNKLDLVMRGLQEHVNNGSIPGASMIVTRGGKIAYEGSVGYSDMGLYQPFRSNTICRLMSMGKPLTAAGIMRLVDQGRLSLDDPLGKFYPKFWSTPVQEGDKLVPQIRPITIRHLLLHTSGIWYSFEKWANASVSTFDAAELPFISLEHMIDNLASKPLRCQPGSRFGYGWSYDVLGAVMEAVSKKSIDVFLHEELFEPMGMHDTGFYVPRSKIRQLSAVYVRGPMGLMFLPVLRPRMDPEFSYRPSKFLSCGGGIVSTAMDYSRFMVMLRNGGTLDGVQILKPESVDLIWSNQMPWDLLPIQVNTWSSGHDMGFGYSWIYNPPKGVALQDAKPKTGSIGWGGFFLTSAAADAEDDLTIVLMSQRVVVSGEPVFVYASLGVLDAVNNPSPASSHHNPPKTDAEDVAGVSAGVNLSEEDGAVDGGLKAKEQQVGGSGGVRSGSTHRGEAVGGHSVVEAALGAMAALDQTMSSASAKTGDSSSSSSSSSTGSDSRNLEVSAVEIGAAGGEHVVVKGGGSGDGKQGKDQQSDVQRLRKGGNASV